MKRSIYILMAVLLLVSNLTACGSDKGTAKGNTEKLSIVTTIFPEYDWVREILGDKVKDAEVTMLLDNGVDLHSYQPTAQDIMKISSCDLFIYVGGESDGWVEDALNTAVNKDMTVINLLEVLGDRVKAEEIVEGMEHEHDHDHEHEEDEDHDHEHEEDDDHDHEHEEDDDHDHEHEDDDHDHDHEHEEEMDEHVWLSLRNAEVLCDAIADALSKIDADNAKVYESNVKAYKEKLAALDGKYTETVGSAAFKTVLFGDRFPFRYLTDDYGLNYYAAFSGCSAESEASFETVLFLAGKVNELKLPSIMTIEGANGKIAETVKNNTESKDQQILTLDSMQSVTSQNVNEGASYLKIMESNLEVLKKALN